MVATRDRAGRVRVRSCRGRQYRNRLDQQAGCGRGREKCMAMLGEITHTTTYKYAKPVTFGTHRAMFLPRRGSSARLLGWSACTSVPAKVHWVTDSWSNAVTVMEFSEPSN